MSCTRSEFDAFWDDLNIDFPPYKVSAEELARQSDRWYEDLRVFTASALREGFRQYARKGSHRPKLSDIYAGAAKYTQDLRDTAANSRGLRAESDSDRCPCGCGGKRWAMALLDGNGKPRKFPTDPHAFASPEEQSVYGVPLADVLKFAGDFMTRDHMECSRRRVDEPPRNTGRMIGLDVRGVEVWMKSQE